MDDRSQADAPVPARRPDELSLEQLEALVLSRRKRRTEQRIRRIVSAQQALAGQDEYVPEEQGVPLRPPEAWRGQGQGDPYLTAETAEPLAEGAAVADARTRQRDVRRNGVMLFAEVALLLGFCVIIGLTFQRLQALNEQVRLLRAATPVLATPQPTPTAVQYLPGVRLQQSDDDESLGVQLGSPEAPAPGAAQRLVIASIDVDAVVVEGDDWESLKQGIGHRPGTVNPGEVGNMVVSAHNDIYGEIFRDLDQMQPGDEVLVYTEEGAYRYVVSSVEYVEPTAIEVMGPTDYAALTLITCYPYLVDTQRVVVRAELAE